MKHLSVFKAKKRERMQGKRIISLILAVSMIFGLLGQTVFGATGSDLDGHWAKSQIESLISKGVVSGYEDGTVKPNNTITRAEFFTATNKLFGFTSTGSASFADVKGGEWYANEVSKAVAAGYVSGYTDNTVKPLNTITRQEVGVIVQKLLALDANSAAADVFKDAGSIASWAKGAVGAAVGADIISGYPDGTFGPTKNITRAEAFTLLSKAFDAKDAAPEATEEPTEATGDVEVEAGQTYGPATGTETVEGDVVISGADATLQNVVVKGKLTIAATVGDGDVSLNNVTVEGETDIYGGGSNSIKMSGTTLQTVNVAKSSVRLVFIGATTAEKVIVVQSANLASQNVTVNIPVKELIILGNDSGSINVTVSVSVGSMAIPANGATVKTTVDITSITIDGEKVNVIVDSGKIGTATINETGIDSRVSINTKGRIDNLHVNAASTIVGTGNIGNVDVKDTVNDKVTQIQNPNTSTSTGGGGGGGGNGPMPNPTAAPTETPSETPTETPGETPTEAPTAAPTAEPTPGPVAVASIVVKGEGDADTITEAGGTLQMIAEVTPEDATDKAVTWSVEDGTGTADISAEGLLTAKTNGTVTVKATSVSTPTVSGTFVVTLSNQPLTGTSPTIAVVDTYEFDKKSEATKADVVITVDLGTLEKAATKVDKVEGNGIAATDYDFAGTTLTIKKAFLDTLTVSTTPYAFDVTFDDAEPTKVTVKITVKESPVVYTVKLATGFGTAVTLTLQEDGSPSSSDCTLYVFDEKPNPDDCWWYDLAVSGGTYGGDSAAQDYLKVGAECIVIFGTNTEVTDALAGDQGANKGYADVAAAAHDNVFKAVIVQ